MKKKFTSFIKGFTAIEILVVISVMGLVTLLTVPSYKTGGRTFALRAAAEQLVTDIEEAKTEALAGRYHVPNDKPDSRGVYIPALNSGNYEIYVSTANVFYWDSGETIEVKTLPFDVEIVGYTPASDFSDLDLNFEFILGNFRRNAAPSPSNGGLPNYDIPVDRTTITLLDPQTGGTAVVELNQAGIVGSSAVANCGNGIIEVGEDCEPPGSTITCEEFNPVFAGANPPQTGVLTCDAATCRWEGGNILSVCTIPDPPSGGPGACGDGILNQNEQCDVGSGAVAATNDPDNCCTAECTLVQGCSCNYAVEPNECARITAYVSLDEGVIHGAGGGGVNLGSIGSFGGGFEGLGTGFGSFGVGGFGGCYVIPQEESGTNMMVNSFFALLLLTAVPTTLVYGTYRLKFAHQPKRR